ncbi:hypothetical protein [Oerskovia enterophila]|uniref:Uncharacterized protein n=1 Tax=Oerskovia enterophila TaxID=43678 RepID=A0A161XDE9_9CELL|nr:hypothetical protein [Oerskovia enterophila]KZM34707.1 hypothetical protein OJAG_25130 [Oerskovia enterophila]
MTDRNASGAHRAAGRPTRRPRPALIAFVGAGAGAVLVGSIGGTVAGFTDEASAVIETGGSYDISLETLSPTGDVTTGQGSPDALVVETTHGTLSRTVPVEWRVDVVNDAAPGAVHLTLYDPLDEPFVLGAQQYPDVYSRLLVTVTVAGAVVARDVPAADLAVDLGALGTDEHRTVHVSAVLSPDTRSVYHGRSTSVGMAFTGSTS